MDLVGVSVWGIVFGALLSLVSLGGAAIWIVGLLWAAREDGRDQAASDAEHGRRR
jgi:hypothetical protein